MGRVFFTKTSPGTGIFMKTSPGMDPGILKIPVCNTIEKHT